MHNTSFVDAVSTLEPGPRVKKTLISEYQSDPLFNQLLRHAEEPFDVGCGFFLPWDKILLIRRNNRDQAVARLSIGTMRWKFWWNENFEPPTLIVMLAEYEENGWRICKEFSHMPINQSTKSETVRITTTNRTTWTRMGIHNHGFRPTSTRNQERKQQHFQCCLQAVEDNSNHTHPIQHHRPRSHDEIQATHLS